MSERYPSNVAPKSTTTGSPPLMRREPGWWCGLAEFSPAATIVSNAVPSAPPRRMAVSSSRAKCSSVTPWLIEREHLEEGGVGDGRRALHAGDLGGVLALAQRLDGVGGGDERLAAEELGPAALAAPGDVARLEADATGARTVEHGAGRLPLFGSRADADLDLGRRRPAAAARPTGCGSGRRSSAPTGPSSRPARRPNRRTR